MSRATLYAGDALAVLRTLPEASVRCCVTSPPYWGLRDYGTPGQLGLEATPEEYVANLVAVFREVRRVLTGDGTLWLNLGDSYTTGQSTSTRASDPKSVGDVSRGVSRIGTPEGLKPKDMVGIPWRVAFALQADGWTLRSDIVWAKPNPMPESVTDRPTKAHEYVFLLAKSERYYYDAAAISEPLGEWSLAALKSNWKRKILNVPPGQPPHGRINASGGGGYGNVINPQGRNARTVWTIATQPYPEAHFATFPEEMARRCILAGSAPTDTVLDPFGGSGTVAAVAVGNGRNAIHIDLNPDYNELARHRIGPMLCDDAAWEAA